MAFATVYATSYISYHVYYGFLRNFVGSEFVDPDVPLVEFCASMSGLLLGPSCYKALLPVYNLQPMRFEDTLECCSFNGVQGRLAWVRQ